MFEYIYKDFEDKGSMTLVTKQSRYYEGILQLRNPSLQIIDFIKSQLCKEEVHVTKEVYVPEGVDLYVTSRKFLRTLATRLKAQFGGTASLTARLHTRDRQTQKDVYRVALLYRAPLLKKGDVVAFEQYLVKIKNVSTFVTGVDIKIGKQLSFKYNPSFEPLVVYETRVVKIYPSLEVLHPATYQPVEVANPQQMTAGEKVKVVFDGHKWYIIGI